MLSLHLPDLRERLNAPSSQLPPWGEYSQALLGQLNRGASQPLKTLGFTSFGRGAGVSTLASHTAICGARQTETPVLLIDANLNFPALRYQFDLHDPRGLADLMFTNGDPLDFVQRTSVDGLSILTAGHSHIADHRLSFSATRFHRILDQLKGAFPLIVLDLPDASDLTCCITIASMLDGVVLVLESEKVAAEAAKRTRDRLLQSQAKILGVVLNKRRTYVPRWLQKE